MSERPPRHPRASVAHRFASRSSAFVTKSTIIVEPGDSCDSIIIRTFHVEAMSWAVSEQQRGNVCAKATGPDGCTFTFEWCDGVPPPPCA